MRKVWPLLKCWNFSGLKSLNREKVAVVNRLNDKMYAKIITLSSDNLQKVYAHKLQFCVARYMGFWNNRVVLLQNIISENQVGYNKQFFASPELNSTYIPMLLCKGFTSIRKESCIFIYLNAIFGAWFSILKNALILFSFYSHEPE